MHPLGQPKPARRAGRLTRDRTLRGVSPDRHDYIQPRNALDAYDVVLEREHEEKAALEEAS